MIATGKRSIKPSTPPVPPFHPDHNPIDQHPIQFALLFVQQRFPVGAIAFSNATALHKTVINYIFV
jgi:hypothetical protein